MSADQRSRALAVEVEVPDVELAPRLLEIRAAAGERRAREAVLGRVDDRQAVVEVLASQERQDGAEDLLAVDARRRLHVADDGRLDEPALLRSALAAGEELGLLLADLD